MRRRCRSWRAPLGSQARLRTVFVARFGTLRDAPRPDQAYALLQFLLRVGLLQETPARAVAAPRFAVWPGTAQTDAAHGVGTVLKCEAALPPAVRAAFAAAGFSIADSPPIGSLKLVGETDAGLTAWADTRREGAVAAV